MTFFDPPGGWAWSHAGLLHCLAHSTLQFKFCSTVQYMYEHIFLSLHLTFSYTFPLSIQLNWKESFIKHRMRYIHIKTVNIVFFLLLPPSAILVTSTALYHCVLCSLEKKSVRSVRTNSWKLTFHFISAHLLPALKFENTFLWRKTKTPERKKNVH